MVMEVVYGQTAESITENGVEGKLMARAFSAGPTEVSTMDIANKGRSMVVEFKHGSLANPTLGILQVACCMVTDL